MTDDASIRQRINELTAQQRELREQHATGEITGHQEQERLRAVETELDQCWDLLRRRDAAREFGGDPDAEEPRPAETVENYLE